MRLLVKLSVVLVPLLMTGTTLAEGSGGAGGRSGTVMDFPCEGCVTRIPAGYDPSVATPLLVTFHGDEGHPRYIHQAFERIVDEPGFLLVSLNCPRDLGCEGSWWRWEAYVSSHDFEWTERQVDAVEEAYNVERQQIFLAGFSGGSSYLSEYIPRYSHRYASALYLGGGYDPHGVGCPECRLPIFFVVGDADFLRDSAEDLRDWYLMCTHDVDFDLVADTDHQIVRDRLPPLLERLGTMTHPCRMPPTPEPEPEPEPAPEPMPDSSMDPDAGTTALPPPHPRSDASPGPGLDPSPAARLQGHACGITITPGTDTSRAPLWCLAVFALLARRRHSR